MKRVCCACTQPQCCHSCHYTTDSLCDCVRGLQYHIYVMCIYTSVISTGLRTRAGRYWYKLQIALFDVWAAGPGAQPRKIFLTHLNEILKQILCTTRPTAPRWKAQIQICQQARRHTLTAHALPPFWHPTSHIQHSSCAVYGQH